MQQLNPQQIKWIEANLWLFDGPGRTITKETAQTLFAIYSWIDGKNHRPTGCGRCIVTAKQAVWHQYKKQLENDDQ